MGFLISKNKRYYIGNIDIDIKGDKKYINRE